MKEKLFFITLAVVISISCLSNKNNLDRKNDPIIAYLDTITNYISYKNATDTTSEIHGYPSYMVDSDSGYWSIAGYLIDSINIHAIVTNLNDSTLNFYHKRNDTWKKIGSDNVDIDYISGFAFSDMNGDGKNEIIAFTYPNMNGNMWPSVYTTSLDGDSIVHAGDFETTFIIKKDQQRLETDYCGSWWMPLVKTIYMWRNEKLVPIKRLQISLKDADMINDDRIIEYFENPTYDQDSLKTVYSRDYLDKDSTIYDNFFRDN